MNFIRLVIAQPVTVAVAVILIIIAGLVSLDRIPIQMTPNVEDTIIAVSTFWEGASPEEIEREIVEKQEEKLQGLSNLRHMTSVSQQSSGQIRLEFAVGTDKNVALQQVSDKLREVPSYPANADQPVIQASDPQNRDYIAWIILECTDPDYDARTLQDFAEDRIKPVLERVEGVSEINVLGGRERETHIRFDPLRLAQYGITPSEFVAAIQRTNRNVSAGELNDGKHNVRLRTVAQYASPDDIERTVIRLTDAGPIFVGDVAEAYETHKEARSFVRSKGQQVIAINAQREVGTNVMQVMAGLKEAIARLNADGGVLDVHARSIGLNGMLRLRQVYDQTVYIEDALALVRQNLWMGGLIAVTVLLLFLRSPRSVAIIALAIPISVIGAVVAMVAMGRSVNVISLAGMAFAIGMVVDNSIVVLENIFRHLEMGKKPMQAAYDGAREVWGAVLASTLTTVAVFIPILLIQDEAGQLFRDIALAICAAILLSLLVSISVVPTTAARLMKQRAASTVKPVGVSAASMPRSAPAGRDSAGRRVRRAVLAALRWPFMLLRRPGQAVGDFIYLASGSVIARVLICAALITGSVVGTFTLMPPADFLPRGNRNLVFGLMIPPPGYNEATQVDLAHRVEATMRPYWEASNLTPGTPERAQAERNLPQVPTFNWMLGAPGDPITPPVIDNYFFVQFDDIMFHGAVSADSKRVTDLVDLFNHATRADQLPGVRAFAFQAPLFQLSGSTGSAVKINFVGDDLNRVSHATEAVFADLAAKYMPFRVQPDPGNFNVSRPELHVVPDKRRLADLGMTPMDLALAVQANGDGAIVGEYRLGGESIDLKIIARDAVGQTSIVGLEDVPIATPTGQVVPLGSLAQIRRVPGPPQINHTGRQRSVSLQFTPPEGMPLEQAITEVETVLADHRARGTIAEDVATSFTGTASKLESVRNALLGDGTFFGALRSTLVLALAVVYLLLCVLFQSFTRPLVIMVSVPLATFGGFAALFAVFIWSVTDRYLPMQMLDILTMLGFIILIGVVVNNAILIVHQTGNFMRGIGEGEGDVVEPMPARRAIAEAVRTRVRPIFMTTMTTVCGLLPLVIMPGAGSELYRGLGAVVLGGLLFSTIFTLFLVPLLLSLLLDFEALAARLWSRERTATPVAVATTRRAEPMVPVGGGAPGSVTASPVRDPSG